MLKYLFFVIGMLISMGQLLAQNGGGLQSGMWRGTLKLVEKEAPFLMEVAPRSDGLVVTLINGEERVELPGVTLQKDSVIIPIESYDAQIRAQVKGGRMTGRFIKNYINHDPGVLFTAEFGRKMRFEPVVTPPVVAIDGKWNVLFVGDGGKTEHNVGIFQTDKGIVTGSVLTSSGDLRFLEGAYTTTGVQLSAFSGLSPYLLEITFQDKNHFEGVFYTTRGKTRLEGTRNDKADLADSYSLTRMKSGLTKLGFALPNSDGKTIALSDERYRNKVVVVSILGSWCPNCLDEMKYLAPWYHANKERGVEIIGIAFERKNDFEYARVALQRLQKKYNPGYELLFGGQVGGEATAKALPEVEKISSYPTTIFIDKKGNVRKIHTGFNGPATGLFYKEFQKEFNDLIDALLSEN